MDDINKEEKGFFGEIMNIKEVGLRIGRKDKESIIKWLNRSKVTIHRLGGLTYVYKVDLECVIILSHVLDRRMKDPDGWELYYQKIIKDEALFQLIMTELKVNVPYKKPTTIVKKSKADQELYKKLVS